MLQFCHTQLPIRFSNCTLAMDPFGLDPIEPGTLCRQSAHDHATAAVPLDAPIVRLEPGLHGLADMPRGIIPHQQQRGFAFGGQPVRQPRQKLRRDCTDRSPIHKAEEHALCIRA